MTSRSLPPGACEDKAGHTLEGCGLIASAEAYCREHGIRFTAPRAAVLRIIADSRKPVGAYDILGKMTKGSAAPKAPTVYRALEFLTQHGFIHRIDSLNAFVACHAGHRHEGSQFTVCDSCGTVEEVHLCRLPPPLAQKLEETGFFLEHWNAELHGTCRSCRG